MRNREQKTASFRLGEADPKTAVDNIAELLDRSDVTREASSDTKLIFEALLRELSNQGFGEDTVIEVSTRKQLDGLRLIVGFEGKVFSPPSDDDGNRERFILCSLGDKINYSYGVGYNSVRITITRSYRNSLFLCALAAVLALVAFLPHPFPSQPCRPECIARWLRRAP